MLQPPFRLIRVSGHSEVQVKINLRQTKFPDRDLADLGKLPGVSVKFSFQLPVDGKQDQDSQPRHSVALGVQVPHLLDTLAKVSGIGGHVVQVFDFWRGNRSDLVDSI